MKRIFFFLVLIFLVCSCDRGNKKDAFSIHGRFSNTKGEKILLCEMDVREVIALDSSRFDQAGEFRFSHNIDQPGFYLLLFPDGRRISLVLMGGEDLMIRGDLQNLYEDLMISGSEESHQLEQFFRETMKNKTRIDSVKSALLSREGSDDFLRFSVTADSVFFRISEDQKKLEKDFIDKHPQSLGSLLVLNYSFGPEPVLTMEDDLPCYQKLTGLSRIYPENKHVLFHLKRLSLYMNRPGKPVN